MANAPVCPDAFSIEQKALRLFAEIPVEEAGQFAEVLLGLGRECVTHVLRVRLALEDIEIRDHARLTQLAVHPHGVREEQVARARGQDGRGKPAKSP